MKPPRLSALKETDLQIKDGPIDGKALRETLRRLFGQLNPYFDGLNGLGSKGITLSDNLRCDVAAGKFSHGIATPVALQQLERAGSVIALGADGALVACQPVLRVTGRKKVEVTVFFNDTTARNVPMKLLFLEEGQPSVTVPTYSTGSMAVTPPWTFAEKPITPDSRDEEFEGTAFTGWTQGGTPDATPIDPYTNAQDSKWRYSWNGTRRSHLLMQGMTMGGGGALYVPPIYKAVTLGTNELISTRMAIDCATSISAGDSLIGFLLYTGAGVPDVNGITTDRVALYLNVSAGAQLKVRHDVVVAGVATIVTYNVSGPVSNGFGALLEPIEYLWLHKLGTTYHAWCASSPGNVIYLGSLVYPGAVDHIAIAIGNTTLHAPGAPRAAIDYVRFKATATDMP